MQDMTEDEIISLVQELTTKSKHVNSNSSNITASEVANLWNQYMGDSSSICFNTFFLHMVEDKQIKSILDQMLELSIKHLNQIASFFKESGFPIPKGFSLEEDVNLEAPRTVSDDFVVYYMEIMAIHGVTTYSLAVSSSEREDVRNYFILCSNEASDLLNKVIQLSKSRGQYSFSPQIPPPDEIGYVEKKNVVYDLFGNPKPLTATEITNLWFNLKKTILAKSAALSFSQFVESEEIRRFFKKVTEMEEKHIHALSEIMDKDHLPTPRSWDADLTTSTISPFSDRLIMFHQGFKFSAAIAYYGSGLGTSMRADIVATYSKIMFEVVKLANEWLSIMVKNHWLEKQPEAADREATRKDG